MFITGLLLMPFIFLNQLNIARRFFRSRFQVLFETLRALVSKCFKTIDGVISLTLGLPHFLRILAHSFFFSPYVETENRNLQISRYSLETVSKSMSVSCFSGFGLSSSFHFSISQVLASVFVRNRRENLLSSFFTTPFHRFFFLTK